MKKKPNKKGPAPGQKKEYAPGKKNPIKKTFTNEKEVALYKKLGYTVDGVNPDPFLGESDAMLKNLGQDYLYTPLQMLSKFFEYVDWGRSNPLYEAKLEKGKLVKIPKMRAISSLGFRLYAGISRRTWWHYSTGKDYEDRTVGAYKDHSKVCNYIEDFIYQYKIEGATADLMNANIIARDLGLTDKKEIKGFIVSGDEPIEFK